MSPKNWAVKGYRDGLNDGRKYHRLPARKGSAFPIDSLIQGRSLMLATTQKPDRSKDFEAFRLISVGLDELTQFIQQLPEDNKYRVMLDSLIKDVNATLMQWNLKRKENLNPIQIANRLVGKIDRLVELYRKLPMDVLDDESRNIENMKIIRSTIRPAERILPYLEGFVTRFEKSKSDKVALANLVNEARDFVSAQARFFSSDKYVAVRNAIEDLTKRRIIQFEGYPELSAWADWHERFYEIISWWQAKNNYSAIESAVDFMKRDVELLKRFPAVIKNLLKAYGG